MNDREWSDKVQAMQDEVLAVPSEPGCLDCGEPYGSPRFPDFVIDDAAWKRIAPNGGLLCPNCICARLKAAGLQNVRGRFTSGPLSLEARL